MNQCLNGATVLVYFEHTIEFEYTDRPRHHAFFVLIHMLMFG